MSNKTKMKLPDDPDDKTFSANPVEVELGCENCVFWKRNPDKGEEHYGECRRYAPQPSRKGMPETLWPLTEQDDWCGDMGVAEDAYKRKLN